jgi:hypothetical protein
MKKKLRLGPTYDSTVQSNVTMTIRENPHHNCSQCKYLKSVPLFIAIQSNFPKRCTSVSIYAVICQF